MTAAIPLVDLAAQHAEVADEVADGWARVLASTAFVGGPPVAAFETAFAAHAGVEHCIGVANGTDALELALRALDVGPGDECVLPANTFIATAEAVARTGATPVLADCDPDTALLDVAAVCAVLSDRTRAVVPVHLYGQTADVTALRAALPPHVAICEDAAQAQGARHRGTCAGALGDLAATSFYPGKNLGAYGDAGAVLTRSSTLAERVRLLGAHGSPRKYDHPVLGFNSRLDTLQAVVLGAKLAHLDRWNEQRRVAAARYDALLADLPLTPPVVAPGNEPVWHLYVIQVERRDEILAHLAAQGIGAGIHYPTPIHLTGAFGHLGKTGDHPHAERIAERILSLPLHPHITLEQQQRVTTALDDALR